MGRRFAYRTLLVLTVIAGAYAVFYFGLNYLLWGRLTPLSHVEKLENPVEVVSWEPQGLRLADGRTVLPAGMIELPEQSDTLRVATKEGVEIAPDGRVFGLVKMWHWCGNDPVRHDISRVDVAQLLAFHQEGKSSLQPHRYAEVNFVKAGGGGPRGWNTSYQTRMRMSFDPRYKEIFAEAK